MPASFRLGHMESPILDYLREVHAELSELTDGVPYDAPKDGESRRSDFGGKGSTWKLSAPKRTAQFRGDAPSRGAMPSPSRATVKLPPEFATMSENAPQSFSNASCPR